MISSHRCASLASTPIKGVTININIETGNNIINAEKKRHGILCNSNTMTKPPNKKVALVLFLVLLKFTPAAITQYLPDRFVTWQGRLERFFDGHKDNLDESGRNVLLPAISSQSV